MKKIILTDCDGVLLDWEPAFYDWMQSKGYDAKNEGIYEMEDVFETVSYTHLTLPTR